MNTNKKKKEQEPYLKLYPRIVRLLVSQWNIPMKIELNL